MATLENAKLLEDRENVSQVELECLKKVYQYIDTAKDNKLDWMEISDVLTRLGHRTPKQEIENMIWEVDDDLDNLVCWDEFLVMYQRCISDINMGCGLEPRNLYNLVQFLMYDKEFSGEISVEQTLQVLYVRYGREKLDSEIQEIFGEEQKLPNGQEKRINYTDYLRKVNARLAKIRNAKKTVSKSK